MLGVVLLGFKSVEGDLALLAVLQFALIPIFVGEMEIFRISGVQWSLFFELVANALHRLLFKWLTNTVLVLICAASLAALVYACEIYPSFTLGWGGDNAWVGLPRVGFPYFAGVLLFRLTNVRRPAMPGWFMLLAFTAIAFVPHIPGIPTNVIRLSFLVLVYPAIVVLSLNAEASPL